MLISFTLDKDGFRVSKPLDARFVTNVTYIKAHFDVSEPTWNDAKVLVAVFKSATYNESCRMILDENNNCFVEPKVFMRGGTIQVKLCGDAYDSDWVRCTTHLTDTIEFYVRPESLLTAEPPSKYAVFLAEIERLNSELTSHVEQGFNTVYDRLSDVDLVLEDFEDRISRLENSSSPQ